jgi:trans-aconitate methyltransferase
LPLSVPASYFDNLYRRQEDPWAFRTRRYEARKRDLTLSSLIEERYGAAFEPGCSIGVLTAGLAARCDRVVAMDGSADALATARRSVPANVDLIRGTVPATWPRRRFDLVVLSELAYYLGDRDCQQLAELAASSAHELIAVHWRHPVDDYPLSGDAAHEIVDRAATSAGLTRLVTHLEIDFRLDVWSADDRSVAQRGRLPGS